MNPQINDLDLYFDHFNYGICLTDYLIESLSRKLKNVSELKLHLCALEDFPQQIWVDLFREVNHLKCLNIVCHDIDQMRDSIFIQSNQLEKVRIESLYKPIYELNFKYLIRLAEKNSNISTLKFH